MLDAFKSFMDGVAQEGNTLFARVKDKNLFRRVVSASYLIARADGDFDSDEKKALAKIIEKQLPQFKIDDILSALKSCEDKVNFDEVMGLMEIMDDIGGASGEDAELIMRISCYIGASDGDFDSDEKKVAKDLAVRMNIAPSKYGL